MLHYHIYNIQYCESRWGGAYPPGNLQLRHQYPSRSFLPSDLVGKMRESHWILRGNTANIWNMEAFFVASQPFPAVRHSPGQLICLFVFKIEDFVQKVDSLDTDINIASENMTGRPLTVQEVEIFKNNILLRQKLYEQLVEMRNGK